MEFKNINLIVNNNKITINNGTLKTGELKKFNIDLDSNKIFIFAETKKGIYNTVLRSYDVQEIKETSKNIIIKTCTTIIKIEK